MSGQHRVVTIQCELQAIMVCQTKLHGAQLLRTEAKARGFWKEYSAGTAGGCLKLVAESQHGIVGL